MYSDLAKQFASKTVTSSHDCALFKGIFIVSRNILLSAEFVSIVAMAKTLFPARFVIVNYCSSEYTQCTIY